MPPRKAISNRDGAPKKKVASKGYKLPDPIPLGFIFTDLAKKNWRLGKSIGQGGFGEIYLASCEIELPVPDYADYVVKIEPHSNGPLFTEMHCYMRIAKPENIETWKKEKKLKHLGMPKFLGSGSLEHRGQKYRFMVMERFGSDLQKIIEKHSKKFSFRTVCEAGMQIIDVLEYIHANEYIHADIKASNLLVGHKRGTENKVFLVDYGLACRYAIDGKHKEYKYDLRKAHDGTIEFTSRDAHIGAHSRRGDLEILGYNLVQWLCGRLPWEDKLQDCDYVATQKRGLMEDVPKFMKKCFPDGVPPGIQEFVEYVASLTFDEKPNYEKCRSILRAGLTRRGYKESNGKLIFLSATPKPAVRKPRSKFNEKKGQKRRSEEEENIGGDGAKSDESPPKIQRTSERFPCKPRNFNNRNTRKGSSPRGSKLTEFVIEPEELIIEKENRKMLARKQELRPRRLAVKKDTSLDNPTPQMLEIMTKIREKSTSPVTPPFCNKKHKHNSHCNLMRSNPATEDAGPTELTYAMEDILRRRERRRSTDSSESSPQASSPQLFDSDDESPQQQQNATLYYSTHEGFCSTSEEEEEEEEEAKPKRSEHRKSKRSSRDKAFLGRSRRRRSSSRQRIAAATASNMRVTRSITQQQQHSPEI